MPVFYTRFVLAKDGSDAGMFDRKIGVARGENVYFAGTHGAEIVADIAPEPGDVVIDKKKPSCFFGTPLQAYLNDRQVDTLIITGGSTANCVRATAVESSSFNYFTVLPREAVFDRIPLSHEVSLFDLDRGFADVVTTAGGPRLPSNDSPERIQLSVHSPEGECTTWSDSPAQRVVVGDPRPCPVRRCRLPRDRPRECPAREMAGGILRKRGFTLRCAS